MLRAAFAGLTEQGFPRDWAHTQYRFGLVWGISPRGDKEANLAKAIACYEAALRVFTEQEFSGMSGP